MSDTTLYAEFRQVLAELELLSHGSTASYNSGGGGDHYADTQDPTGESHPPHLYWRTEWEKASDDARRAYILERARAELRSFRKRTLTSITIPEETELELEERVVNEGVGWSVDEVALKCRCTPTFVRRARLKAGADVLTGIKPDDRQDHPPPDKVEHARELAARHLSERQIAMITKLPKTTIRRILGRAA